MSSTKERYKSPRYRKKSENCKKAKSREVAAGPASIYGTRRRNLIQPVARIPFSPIPSNALSRCFIRFSIRLGSLRTNDREYRGTRSQHRTFSLNGSDELRTALSSSHTSCSQQGMTNNFRALAGSYQPARARAVRLAVMHRPECDLKRNSTSPNSHISPRMAHCAIQTLSAPKKDPIS